MESANSKRSGGAVHLNDRLEPVAQGASSSAVRLPKPDPQGAARSERLRARLRQEITRAGAIPFSRYMEWVLYCPRLGYYSAEASQFGPRGDFVTAPELSTLFTRCLACPIADALSKLSADEVLELGAGSGRMASDLLLALESNGTVPRRYVILERSPALRCAQRKTLAHHVPHLMKQVTWIEDLPATGFRGVIVANEVLDAMPVCRFRVMPDRIREWYVGMEENRLVWKLGPPAEQALEQAVDIIQQKLDQPLPSGYDSEVNLVHTPWVRRLAERLAAGLILLIDYGYPRREYYHPQRDRGTLVCYYRHRAHDDPLIFPGLQDISVHVDFTTIAHAAAASGLEIAGFTTQANFLLATGLTDLLTAANPESPAYATLTRQVKRLILPGEMGELVKVMALTRGLAPPIRGFTQRDLRDRL